MNTMKKTTRENNYIVSGLILTEQDIMDRYSKYDVDGDYVDDVQGFVQEIVQDEVDNLFIQPCCWYDEKEVKYMLATSIEIVARKDEDYELWMKRTE